MCSLWLQVGDFLPHVYHPSFSILCPTGYSIFVVVGVLPQCEAHQILTLAPVQPPLPPVSKPSSSFSSSYHSHQPAAPRRHSRSHRMNSDEQLQLDLAMAMSASLAGTCICGHVGRTPLLGHTLTKHLQSTRYVYMYMCVCSPVCVCVCTPCVCACSCVCSCVCVCVCSCVCVCVCVCPPVCVCVCVLLCVCVCRWEGEGGRGLSTIASRVHNSLGINTCPVT